ncbi:MAG: hypothetical protein H0W06_00450, partial [Chloroflexia bacterium]|nr:hypothetical protein [Chloroflexia bacterium]
MTERRSRIVFAADRIATVRVAAEMVIIVLTILAEEEQVLVILPVFADNGVVGGHRGNSGLHRRSVIAN